MKAPIALILLAITANAQTLAEYPALFFDNNAFNASIITADERDFNETMAINYIINTIPKYRISIESKQRDDTISATPQEVGNNIRRAGEIEHITQNAILIGTTCGHDLIKKILLITNCETLLKSDEALATIFTMNGKQILIITAQNGKMVYEATKYLHENPRQLLVPALYLKNDIYTYPTKKEIIVPAIRTKAAPEAQHEYNRIKKRKKGTLYTFEKPSILAP